jgi:predicted nucleotidyltransferase
MRFHGLAEGIISSPKRMAVVRTILMRPSQSWTGRQLARESGVSPRWAIETLRALEAEGVVQPWSVPPAVLWKVNQRHILLRLLKDLTDLDGSVRRLLLDDLRKVVAPTRPIAAILFGSTARRDEQPGSDVDLLVVIKAARDRTKVTEALIDRGSDFFWKFGNRLAPIVITEREFRAKRGYGFVGEALREGIWVWGERGDG